MSELSSKIKALLPELKELRHQLHMHPELGLECHETAKRILEFLSSIPDLEIKTGLAESGIIATLNKDKSGPCVGLRADFDALPIEEETGLPYASTVQGRMHACGHDGHTACLLGAVKILSEMREQLSGPVRFIFQPGEESSAGAKFMLQEGALENPNVDVIFGLHGWPGIPVGHVGTAYGPFLASVDEFEITVEGAGTHAAFPHTGIDPIVIGASITTALQTIPSRYTDPLDSVVVGITCFNAGIAKNIIPTKANMLGTLRTLHPETRVKSKKLVEQICINTAKSYGGKASVEFDPLGYPPLINHEKPTRFLDETAKRVLGEEKVFSNSPAQMGAEDFSFFLEKTPGSFFIIGLVPEGKESMPMLHTPYFDFSDDAIETGVTMHCELALNY